MISSSRGLERSMAAPCSCSKPLALRPPCGRRRSALAAGHAARRRGRSASRVAAHNEDEAREAQEEVPAYQSWYEQEPEVEYVPQWPNPQFMEVRSRMRPHGA